VTGKLVAVEPISVVGEPKVDIAFPNWSDIPSRILGYKVTYVNCTPVEQNFTFEHTRQIRVGSKVTKTKTLQTTTAINAKVSFDFILKGETTISFSQMVGLSNAEEQSYETTETLRYATPIRATAMGVTTTKHWWVHRSVPVKFNGTVELDTAIAPNAESFRSLSAVLPSKSDRVFDFSGVVENSDLVEALTAPVFKALSDAECSAMNVSRRDVVIRPEHYVESCAEGKCEPVSPLKIR
jgi:hypothetical protein